MKIVYLHQYFKKPTMSGGTRSYEMAKRLLKSGHEVHIISCWNLETEHKDWFYEEFEGLKIHWLPSNYHNSLSFKQRVQIFLKFAFSCLNIIKTINADVIFATSTPLTIGIPGVLGSRYHKIPLVFEVRDLWPDIPIKLGFLKNPFLKFAALKLESWIYQNSRAIVALSPGMREGVTRNGYPISSVAVIPNSCDIELFDINEAAILEYRKTHLKELTNKKIILYAGTFGFVNDLLSIVPIAAEIKKIEPEIVFLFVGDGAQKESVISLTKKLGVYNVNTFFKDRVPKSEVPLLFKNSTVSASFALNVEAIQANSANKFFDSLAANRPVLINYEGWQKDIIETHQCGISIAGQSTSEAANNIVSFINDQSALKTSIDATKYLAENVFARDILAKQLEEVLNYAVGTSKVSPYEVTKKFYRD